MTVAWSLKLTGKTSLAKHSFTTNTGHYIIAEELPPLKLDGSGLVFLHILSSFHHFINPLREIRLALPG